MSSFYKVKHVVTLKDNITIQFKEYKFPQALLKKYKKNLNDF